MRKLLFTLALVSLFATPALADRNVDGSYVELVTPLSANPGDVVWMEFFCYNASTDAEWLVLVEITLSECMTVLDGYLANYTGGGDFMMGFFGIGGNVCGAEDLDGGYGEVYGESSFNIFAQVEIGEDCEPGTHIFPYGIYGDIWGDEPHEVFGEIEFEVGAVANEPTTWSSVKSLYQ